MACEKPPVRRGRTGTVWIAWNGESGDDTGDPTGDTTEAGYSASWQADRGDGWRYDYRNSYAYQDANYGYNGYYIDQDEYNYYFRQGFQRGYQDGYNSRSQYGQVVNGKYQLLGSLLSTLLNLTTLR